MWISACNHYPCQHFIMVQRSWLCLEKSLGDDVIHVQCPLSLVYGMLCNQSYGEPTQGAHTGHNRPCPILLRPRVDPRVGNRWEYFWLTVNNQ